MSNDSPVTNEMTILAKEITNLKKIRRNLVNSIEKCQNIVKTEKELRLNVVKHLESSVNNPNDILWDLSVEDRVKAQSCVQKYCWQGANSDLDCSKIIAEEIDDKLRRLSLIELEVERKFFPKKLLNSPKIDENYKNDESVSVEHYEILSMPDVVEDNCAYVNCELASDSVLKECEDNFRRFTVVTEDGIPLPEKSEENIFIENDADKSVASIVSEIRTASEYGSLRSAREHENVRTPESVISS